MGGLQDPPHHPRHIYDIKTTMSSVCLCTGAFNCTENHSLPKINLNVNIVLKVDLYHTSVEGKEGKNKLNPLGFFFFACQKFPDSWKPPPSPTKIPRSAPAASSLFCTAVSRGLFTRFSGSCRKYARGRSNLANTCMFHKRKFIY